MFNQVLMAKGATVNYTWSTDGGNANFDAHADSRKLNINYHSYEKGSESAFTSGADKKEEIDGDQVVVPFSSSPT